MLLKWIKFESVYTGVLEYLFKNIIKIFLGNILIVYNNRLILGATIIIFFPESTINIHIFC